MAASPQDDTSSLVQVAAQVHSAQDLFYEGNARLLQLVVSQAPNITRAGRVQSYLDPVVPHGYIVSCIVLASVLGIFFIFSIPDFHSFLTLPRLELRGSKKIEGGMPAIPEHDQVNNPGKQPPASIPMILGLTFYRFYTGFLSATWLPYLLAMEGAALWEDNQALFMGLAKLLYGLSILMTPIFGLLGDKIALKSHALGRRLFVRVGIIVAALGIFLCHWSAQSSPKRHGHFSLFMLGILVWRLGEGLNDVTTEAICPEMLPSTQYAISSSIRAAMFLIGGLLGYILVMVLASFEYYWLYHGYLIAMFVCGIPPLLAISKDVDKSHRRGADRDDETFLESCMQAYVKPSQYEGGFPCACLCTFLFSCGSAPMFFLLLMLRDLVGIVQEVHLRKHFGLISMVFFLSAAVAAVLNAVCSPKKPQQGDRRNTGEIRVTSFRYTAFAVMSFGVVCILLPFVTFFPQKANRAQAFYFLAALLGATFGSVYARFQDCTWQLLPQNVEFANAMGFSTMWKLLGAGLGNFIAGLILDLFPTDHPRWDAPTAPGEKSKLIAYQLGGYMAVCWISALLAFATGGLVLTIPRKAMQARPAEDKEVESNVMTAK